MTFSAEFLALAHGSKLHLPKCNLKLREKLISTPAWRFELLNSLPDGFFFFFLNVCILSAGETPLGGCGKKVSEWTLIQSLFYFTSSRRSQHKEKHSAFLTRSDDMEDKSSSPSELHAVVQL